MVGRVGVQSTPYAWESYRSTVSFRKARSSFSSAVDYRLDSDDVHRIAKNDRLGTPRSGFVESQGNDRPRNHQHLGMTNLKGGIIRHPQSKREKRAVVELLLDL